MRLILGILLVLGTMATAASYNKPDLPPGGGKMAYRHYFFGNYYYGEAQPQKALTYFRKAYRAAGNRLTFALAYALTLAETGQPQSGLEVMAQARKLLLPLHPEYEQQLINYYHVDAIIRTRARQYGKAAISLNRAIYRTETQELSLVRDRLAGMYSLSGYLKIMNQENPRRHAGLSAHAHLQSRELEAAFPIYEKALSLDSTRRDARQNLQMLSDTLAREFRIEPLKLPRPDYQKLGVYNVNDFPHLPDHIEELLPFGQYDELLFLVDISGSMVMEQVGCTGADRFTVMKEATRYLLNFLPDSTLAGLATIGGDCEAEPDWWIAPDSISRKELLFQIRYLNSNGTTPLLTTLLRAPELFSEDTKTTKSIFFVSDGENVCSVPGVDICEWADRLADRNITLNVLTFLDKGLNNSGAFAEYACLADRSGGQVRYLDPISCSIDEAEFDLMDQVTFNLPRLERVHCWGKAVEKLWAIFPKE